MSMVTAIAKFLRRDLFSGSVPRSKKSATMAHWKVTSREIFVVSHLSRNKCASDDVPSFIVSTQG